MPQSRILTFIFCLLSSVTLLTCGVSPKPINYGRDECEHCRMMITDNKYGAEVITSKGKVYKFDSIECLVGYGLEINIIGDYENTFLVTNFSKPENLIDARSAFYIHNDNFRSPMGLNVSAFGRKAESQEFLSKGSGKELSLFDVIEMVKQSTM
jgi:copper chaperone NosL